MYDLLASFISGLGSYLISVLPTSPFQQFIPILSGMQTGLGWLNWFIPFKSILVIMGVWLVAITIFYLWKPLSHWIGISD
jgi:hypothetical protein